MKNAWLKNTKKKTKSACNYQIIFYFRAEQLALAQSQNAPAEESAKRSHRGGSFFKKKTARRAKSLGKDHWDDVVFGMYI